MSQYYWLKVILFLIFEKCKQYKLYASGILLKVNSNTNLTEYDDLHTDQVRFIHVVRIFRGFTRRKTSAKTLRNFRHLHSECLYYIYITKTQGELHHPCLISPTLKGIRVLLLSHCSRTIDPSAQVNRRKDPRFKF